MRSAEVIASTASENHDVTITVRSTKKIQGKYRDLPISFVSKWKGGQSIVVTLTLRNKELIATYEIDEKGGGDLVTLQTQSKYDDRNIFTQEDRDLLVALCEAFIPIYSSDVSVERELAFTLEFISSFIPVGEEIDLIDWSTKKNKQTKFIEDEAAQSEAVKTKKTTKTYSLICDARGDNRAGSYTAPDPASSDGVVGDPADDCLGRCGIACFQKTQKKKRQYTQECFDHDLCTRATGGVLGECKDEFKTASYGYRKAPNCDHYIIGKWSLMFDWNCDGDVGSTTWTFFDSFTFVADDFPLPGTWSVFEDSVTVAYSNRTVYEGEIAESDLNMDGTSLGFSGGSGCWDATHTTVSVSP
ncbi:hypothetical protein N9H39_03085 [Gammaproteobacteria bacterium]|nr:hypothetical protein [Gammaproteobacteria bacterium]